MSEAERAERAADQAYSATARVEGAVRWAVGAMLSILALSAALVVVAVWQTVALRGDVAAVQAVVAEVQSDVAAVQSDVAEVQSDIAETRSEVAEVQSNVAVLMDGMRDIADRLFRLEAARSDSDQSAAVVCCVAASTSYADAVEHEQMVELLTVVPAVIGAVAGLVNSCQDSETRLIIQLGSRPFRLMPVPGAAGRPA